VCILLQKRKLSHVDVCLSKPVEFKDKSTCFEDVHLVHNSLPEFNLGDVDLGVDFLGHRFGAPIIISAMTGGSEVSYKINRVLGIAAERLGLGMGVGSQRIALEKLDVSYTFSVVREVAPDIFLMGNLGAAQFSLGYGLAEALKAVEMVDADALAVHLNALQEAVQSEGEPHYGGVLAKIEDLCSSLSVPVVVKETGAGISGDVASLLKDAGVSAIDVGGAGGTSWAAVEYYRSLESGDLLHSHLAESFWDWGIPTSICISEVRSAVDLPIIATGGVRSGLDAVKALALGADVVGLALPLLRPAFEEGVEGVLSYLTSFIEELRVAMFLVGARTVADLSSVPLVVTGFMGSWMRLRGLVPEALARRGKKF